MSGRGGRNAKAVREFKASGNKAMQAGAFNKAMRLYTKALELDAGNAILYSNRSAAHFNIRQFSESLEDAESAILCDGTWWKAYKRKGLALIHMQRYEEAIQALDEGLKIVGKNAEMEKNLEFAKACHEQAQNLYILPEPHMMQRLESVPVFIVTDNVGQPFFVTYDDGQQVCTFYFDQEDAKATLEWIKSENPDLGDTARVIHITLHQAFNLAQETQKQYYEETTRAAAEEDRRAALAATEPGEDGKQSSGGLFPTTQQDDVEKDSDDGEDAEPEEDKPVEEKVEEEEKPEKDGDSEVPVEIDATAPLSISKTDEASGAKKDDAGAKPDDGVIDENAPLSFQFRPELRQVQVAVELLNKNPNPPVRPILRDPPSVRKARAEAAAAAATDETGEEEVEDKKETESVNGRNDEKVEESEADKSELDVKEDVKGTEETDDNNPGDDEENVELTVDNFNGIPIFQAKGLTLLQKNKQLIPLFFSKWDLEAAWKQLKESNAIDVPGECEIEVGTLEDVLRRMSENKTDELESVFFVPSRESMKAINVKFPLDELASPAGNGGIPKTAVKKAGFSKAKQIAARGGTKDEIRAAIREDLEKHAERQRMAEIVAQIEQARRTGGVGGVGGVGLGTTSSGGGSKGKGGAGVKA